MSLRKSPQLTPQLLVATRHNAQHSTGPRSPTAKQNSKLNALKRCFLILNSCRRRSSSAASNPTNRASWNLFTQG
jgi:hypothetical protein